MAPAHGRTTIGRFTGGGPRRTARRPFREIDERRRRVCRPVRRDLATTGRGPSPRRGSSGSKARGQTSRRFELPDHQGRHRDQERQLDAEDDELPGTAPLRSRRVHAPDGLEFPDLPSRPMSPVRRHEHRRAENEGVQREETGDEPGSDLHNGTAYACSLAGTVGPPGDHRCPRTHISGHAGRGGRPRPRLDLAGEPLAYGRNRSRTVDWRAIHASFAWSRGGRGPVACRGTAGRCRATARGSLHHRPGGHRGVTGAGRGGARGDVISTSPPCTDHDPWVRGRGPRCGARRAPGRPTRRLGEPRRSHPDPGSGAPTGVNRVEGDLSSTRSGNGAGIVNATLP